MTSLGEDIRQLRKEKRITQEQLTGGIITRAGISAVELGKTWPNIETLDQITHALNLPYDTFYEKYFEGTEHEGQLFALALKLFSLGDIAFAHRVMGKCIAKAKKKGRKTWLTRCLMQLGTWEENLGHEKRAIRIWEKAAQWSLEQREWDRFVLLATELGHINHKLGMLYNAWRHYQRAKDFINLTANPSPEQKIKILWALSSVLWDLDLKDMAIENYQEMLIEAEKSENLPAMAEALMALGSWNRHNFTTAENQVKKALAIYTEINDINGIASAENSLGMLYADQKHWNKALEHIQESFTLHEQTDSNNTGNTYNELARIYLGMQKIDAAKEVLLMSLKNKATSALLIGTTYQLLAEVAQIENEPQKATEYLLFSAQIFAKLADNNSLNRTLENLSELLLIQKS